MANEVQKVSVDILKVHSRNQEFFDDISGQDYENFKKSIKEEGIILGVLLPFLIETCKGPHVVWFRLLHNLQNVWKF